jgi:hypothetical protein
MHMTNLFDNTCAEIKKLLRQQTILGPKDATMECAELF